MAYNFGVGLIVVDFIGRESWGVWNLAYFREQFSQRDNDSISKNTLNMGDICFTRHILSNSQKPIFFLSNYL